MRWAAASLAIAAVLAGCGLNVQSPDVLLVTRTGQGRTLTVVVNDGGTIRCNGARARRISDPLLLQARDLATALGADAKAGLRIRASANSVFRYKFSLPDGTVSFPDTAAGRHHELAQAELFTVRAAEQGCGISG